MARASQSDRDERLWNRGRVSLGSCAEVEHIDVNRAGVDQIDSRDAKVLIVEEDVGLGPRHAKAEKSTAGIVAASTRAVDEDVDPLVERH